MAQFDANVNLRVNVQEANKQLNKVERRLRQLERGTISRNKRNQGLASNLITGSKAAGANVGARIARQNLDAQKKALRVADNRVEKEIRLAAALQRQETILKALTRAGGTNSKAAQDRVDSAIKASKEAKTNLGIQQAVNTLLEKELQIRREINRVANASNEAKSVGSRRGKEIQGFGLPAEQEKKLLKLNAAYVTAAEKGQADIAKAINRKVEREVKGIRKVKALEERNRQKKIRDDKRAQDKKDREALAGVRKLERAEESAARKRKRDRANFRNNLGAGIGFPLLFGGGPGSVIGGAAGAAGGFGLSILLSSVGTVIDRLGAAALETARIFNELTDSVDDLIPVARNLGGSAQARFLVDQGLSAQVATILREEFAERTGRDLTKEAETAERFDNAVQGIGNTLQALLTGPLNGISRILEGLVSQPSTPGRTNDVKQAKIQQQITTFESVASRGPLTENQKKRLETLKSQLAVLKDQRTTIEDTTNAERRLNALVKERLDLLKDLDSRRVAIAQNELTARRDTLSVDKGALEVAEARAEVNRLQAEYDKETAFKSSQTTANLKLGVQLQEAKTKLTIAEANAANDLLQTQRQITAEEAKLFQATLNANNNKIATANQIRVLEDGVTATFNTRIEKLKLIQQAERNILISKQAQELVTVREGEIMDQLIKKQEAERKLMDNRQYLQARQLIAQNAAANDRQQALVDTRELVTLEAQLNAERLKRATDPNYMMSFAGAGLGFFSDSSKLEADQIAERAAQLERFNVQVADLQKRLTDAKANKADFAVIDGLEQRILDVKNLRENYAQLQPEIDAAALAQARFNDAFAAVSPAVNSLVNGLKEVVAGTKTAEEAFVDFLNTIADQLIQTAATMIAQYIAIAIARSFAGMSGGSSGPDFSQFGTNTTGVPTNFIKPAPFQYAEGGFVTGPTSALVGEAGETEYVIPSSKMGEAMGRYSNGARGESVIPGKNGEGYAGGGSSGGTIVNYNGPTLSFNSEDYVPASAVPGIIDAAAKKGAKAGEQRTFTTLRNSRSQRSSIGI